MAGPAVSRENDAPRQALVLSFVLLLGLGAMLVSPRALATGSDLSVDAAEISSTPPEPFAGTPFGLHALVRNLGDAEGTATVRFVVGDLPMPSDAGWSWERDATVAAGDATLVSVQAVVPVEGTYLLTVTLLNETFTSGNTTNDVAFTTLRVLPPLPPEPPALLLQDANATISEGAQHVLAINVTATGGFVPGVRLTVLDSAGLAAVPEGEPIDLADGQTKPLALRLLTPELRPGAGPEIYTLLVTATGENATSNVARVTVIVLPEAAFPPARPGAPLDLMLLASLIATVVLGTVVGSVHSFDRARYRFFGLLLPLYTRVKREAVLDQYTRGKIHGYLLANPGDYFTAIAKALDVPAGTLAYHLAVLKREGHITSRKDGVHRRFYPEGVRIVPDAGRELSSVERALVEAVRRTPGMKQKDLADLLGLRPPTVSYHLQKLIRSGLIASRRLGMSVRYTAKEIGDEDARPRREEDAAKG